MESSPIIRLHRPFSLNYSVKNYPTVPDRVIYARIGMHLATYPINPVTPQFVDHGLSTVNALNKGAGIWSPYTRARRFTDAAHCSAPNISEGEITAVVETLRAKSDYNYKIHFEIWRGNLQFECPKDYKESPAFGLDSCWCKNFRRKSTSKIIVSYLYKNAIPQNTRNGIFSTQIKSAKIVRTIGPRVRPKFVRLIVKKTQFVRRQQI